MHARIFLLCAGLVLALGACDKTIEVGTDPIDDPNPAPLDPDPQPTPEPTPEPTPTPDPQPTPEPTPDPGCTDDIDCGDGEGMICEAGVCVEGCRENAQCPEGRICADGACVECTGDLDCTVGFVCEAAACVEGCRDTDDGCPEGQICEDATCLDGCRDDDACGEDAICEDLGCVEGCRDDAACDEGSICEDLACTTGCRDDASCGEGSICEDLSCTSGCRDDAGCNEGSLCIDEACIFAGIGCREDTDCNEGDICDTEINRCEPDSIFCDADDLEPNNLEEDASPLEAGAWSDLTICPDDTDFFTVSLEAGSLMDIEVVYNRNAGDLIVEVNGQALELEDEGQSTTIETPGEHTISIAGANGALRMTYALSIDINEAMLCTDTQLFSDTDMDGYGDTNDAITECLEDGQTVEGFVSEDGDCGPGDPWRNPGAQEICGDFVDDDCDGSDAACPTSQPSVVVPDWDCTGDAPQNVYAFAKFTNGGGYFQDGGCFMFFEGLPGEFYVKRNIERSNQDPNCERRNGCTCPSLNGWPSYDRRMYAFTLGGEVEDCPDISIRDHGGEQQDVSNACRKYLYQMHAYDIPFSYVGSDVATIDHRMALYPTVEIACVEDAPHRNLPFQSLLTATIERNPGYQAQ